VTILHLFIVIYMKSGSRAQGSTAAVGSESGRWVSMIRQTQAFGSGSEQAARPTNGVSIALAVGSVPRCAHRSALPRETALLLRSLDQRPQG